MHAVEADPLARQWAERNIASCAAAAPHTAGRVTLHGGDFATALPDLNGAVDLVISNPPYIPAGSWVPPEVGEYDPATALWGGEDGLDAIRVVESVARRLLRPGGLVAVEHGAPQGAGRLLGVRRGERLAGHPQPPGPGRAGPVRERDLEIAASVAG